MRGNEYRIGKATKMRKGEASGGGKGRGRCVGRLTGEVWGVASYPPGNSEVLPDGGYGVKYL